jgi:serine/threonine-protein kinase
MVDRDGGSGPRTELDLDEAAAAAVEAAQEPSERDIPARGTRNDLDAERVREEARIRASGSVPPTDLSPDFEHDATGEQVSPAQLRDRATELDLDAAAAAAVEAARQSAAEPVRGDHETQLGPPAATGTPPPKPARAIAFAPTAALAEVTSDSPKQTSAEPFEELPEGTLLAGRYHVSALVGQGGMGAVYAAHDDDLDEDIALKVLRPDLARDADFQRRLRAEVRLARRVSHPNVCRVHDIGIDDELVFVTMELVRGRTLREMLAETMADRREPLELAQIVDIIVQIGSALTAAHRAGVIHRDVKPDNVIVAGGRAVLTDFGVASMVVDRRHAIVGTPAYLAPEVLRGEPFDHRVDIYAVSCLAYELIAGAPPFAARTLEAAMKLAKDRPSYPGLPDTFAIPTVRSALDRVLLRGLASDPQLRPPTMERLTDSLAHAARGAPLSLAVPGRRQERL